jgi:hypothetical protein
MPMEIEHDGKKLTVYTKDEVDAAVTAAKTDTLTKEDAQKLADSAAAKARREAEGELKKLQDELAKSGNSAEKIAQLEKQIAEQAGKITGSEKQLAGIRALVNGGLTLDQAEFLIAHPKFGDAKLDSDDGVKAALESAKGLGFAPATATPPKSKSNGAPGSPTERGDAKPATFRDAVKAHYTESKG